MSGLSAIAAEHGLEGDEEEWTHDMGWQNDDDVRSLFSFPLFNLRISSNVQLPSFPNINLLCSGCHHAIFDLTLHYNSTALLPWTYLRHSTSNSSKPNRRAPRTPLYLLNFRLTFHPLHPRPPTSAGFSP
jgi:hypothetical protein